MKTGTMPVVWFVENSAGKELTSLEEALADLKSEMPSAEFVRVEGETSGGWPVYEIAVADSDAPFLAYLMGCDINELKEV